MESNLIKKKPKIIGIIMTYNCADLVEDIYRRLPKDVFDEIIIVDDGSRDNVAHVARKLGVPLFVHEHLGYGGNIKYGLRKALEMGGNYMVEIHGDGQYDPRFIKPGLEKIGQGYDLVLGSRFTDIKQPLRDKKPFIQYVGNMTASFFDRLILNIPLTEFHTGFKIYSKRLVATVNLAHNSNSYACSFEIVAQARFCNLAIAEIPVRCDYTKKHTSAGLWHSSWYFLQTFYVLFKYVLARIGFKVKIFNCGLKISSENR